MSWKSEEPCVVCNRPEDIVYHHVITRGSRKDLQDEAFNKMPLCFEHHRFCHDRGLGRFAIKYSQVRAWLRAFGWSYDPFLEKWRHDDARFRD